MPQPHVSMSTVLQYIREDLGLFEVNETDNETIEHIVKQWVIPRFSAFYPFYLPYVIDTGNLQSRDRGSNPNVYVIDLPDPSLTLRGVSSLAHNETKFIGGTGGEINGAPTSFDYTQFAWGLMMDQATVDVWGAATLPDRIQFMPPNSVHIIAGYGQEWPAKYSGRYGVRLHLDHPPHLTTIRPNIFDKIFLDYALLTFKKMAYARRKRFESLSTPLGEITTGLIDEFASARDELKTMEEEVMENDAQLMPQKRRFFST